MDRSAEIERTLKRLKIPYKLVSNNYMISCPMHSDENPSFGIRRDGVWNCFSCNESGGWKDLSKLLGFRARKFSFEEIVNDKFRQFRKESKQMKSAKLPYDFVEYGENPPASVLERVTLELIKKYGIGEATSTFPRYFIIPIRVKGYDSYICRHRIRKPLGNERRWRFAAGFTKVLFPNPTQEIVIVEGILDAFAVEDFGFSASACFGHLISDLQISQLLSSGTKDIILLLDDYEDHYLVSLKRIFKMMKDLFNISAMKLGKDADEVDRDTFLKAYEERIYLSDEMDRVMISNFQKQVLRKMKLK